MFIAECNGIRIVATEAGQDAVCPWCRQDVYSRNSDYCRLHWVHYPNCGGKPHDPWYESNLKSEWHTDWQAKVPPTFREVRVGDHYADVRRLDGTVVEFQHSRISRDTIAERENAYGSGMWVVDMTGRSSVPTWCRTARWPVLLDRPPAGPDADGPLHYLNGNRVAKSAFTAWMNSEIGALPVSGGKRLARQRPEAVAYSSSEEGAPCHRTLFTWQLEDTPAPPAPSTRCRSCWGHGRPGWVRTAEDGRWVWRECSSHIPLTSSDPNFPRGR